MTAERFLVTGAHGCIGAWVIRRLISEGADVVALDVSDDAHRLRMVLSESELAALVSPDLAGQVSDVIAEHAAIYNDNALPDEINRMCLADTRLFLPGLNLAYTDRASMAASVEVRVPFVDPVVARAAFYVPSSVPTFVSTYVATQDLRAIVLAALNIVVATAMVPGPVVNGNVSGKNASCIGSSSLLGAASRS